MFKKRGRRVFKRNGRGRHMPLRKAQAKAVRHIASRVVNRRIETKRIQYTNSFVSSNGITGTGYIVDLVTSLNAAAGLAQGTQENERVGDVIHCRGIRLRMSIANHPYNSDTTYQQLKNKIGVRIMVVGTKDATATRGDILENDSFPAIQAPDTDKVKVLYDRFRYLHTEYTGALAGSNSMQTFFDHSIWVPGAKIGWRGKLQFVDNSATDLKGYRYYLAIFPSAPNDGAAECCSIIWNGMFYFKDA